jgi:hypothetical protein
VWQILVPMGVMGISQAFMWGPLGATANRNLPMHSAGAGAGIYNTTRQVGAVLGSAAIAAVIEARLAAHLPGAATHGGQFTQASGVRLPAPVAHGFSAAMADAMLLPAAVLLIGVVAAFFFERPTHPRRP